MGKTMNASQGWREVTLAGDTHGADLLKLDNQLCFAMYAASRAIIAVYRERLEPLGLTYPQFLVLTVLWEENKVSLTTIGRRLRLDSGTLTPLVKRLEVSGLVTRDRRTSDEREIEIGLTEAGHALKEKAIAVAEAVTQQLAMNSEMAAQMKSELNSVVQTLDAQEASAAQQTRARVAQARR